MIRRTAMFRIAAIPALLACLLSLSCSTTAEERTPASGLATVPVTLPDGSIIRCEMAMNVLDQARGLMFREQLPADHGMLFVFMEEAPRSFWMFRTRIPLDIIWLDSNRNIVEISADTPPCPADLRDNCPSYGGNAASQFVIEIGAGQAAARGLKIGDPIRF